MVYTQANVLKFGTAKERPYKFFAHTSKLLLNIEHFMRKPHISCCKHKPTSSGYLSFKFLNFSVILHYKHVIKYTLIMQFQLCSVSLIQLLETLQDLPRLLYMPAYFVYFIFFQRNLIKAIFCVRKVIHDIWAVFSWIKLFANCWWTFSLCYKEMKYLKNLNKLAAILLYILK